MVLRLHEDQLHLRHLAYTLYHAVLDTAAMKTAVGDKQTLL